MRLVRVIALGVSIGAAALMLQAGAFAATSNPTMGDFLSAYAKALNIELPANATGETVVAALRASGVKLDATVDSAKSLTQGDVVRIGKANGLRVSSSNPENAFTSVEMGQFFASYGAVLAGTNNTRVAASDNPPGDPASHANTAKGQKKGRPFQCPSEPE